jgi:hypothetical protein
MWNKYPVTGIGNEKKKCTSHLTALIKVRHFGSFPAGIFSDFLICLTFPFAS